MRYLLAIVGMFTAVLNGMGANVCCAPMSVDTMKVMSYNIRYSNTIDLGETSWESRRQPSIDMILDERPDVIGLQEPRPNQRKDLITGLGDIYGLFCAADDGVIDKRTGYTAIMYRKDRFTVLDKGYYWLSPTPDVESRPAWGAEDTHHRTTVWMLLHDNYADRDILMCNTHLPYKSVDKAAREACVKLIIDRLKEKATDDMAVLVTGDMNASWHTADGRRDCLKDYYSWMGSAREDAPLNLKPDVYSFNCFGAKKPAVTWNIDHIFYRNVTPLEFNVVDSDKYGVRYVSDHFPITLLFRY